MIMNNSNNKLIKMRKDIILDNHNKIKMIMMILIKMKATNVNIKIKIPNKKIMIIMKIHNNQKEMKETYQHK